MVAATTAIVATMTVVIRTTRVMVACFELHIASHESAPARAVRAR
jgi:hypothetical protein